MKRAIHRTFRIGESGGSLDCVAQRLKRGVPVAGQLVEVAAQVFKLSIAESAIRNVRADRDEFGAFGDGVICIAGPPT